MAKILLSFFSLIIVVIAFMFYQKLSTPIANIKTHEFQLLIARSETDKQIGLSKHDNLAADKAMVFIFEKPDYHRFWMKDMKFPIDLIFIKGNKIVKIYENAPKLKEPIDNIPIYSPPELIDKALEINAGLSKKYNFKIGDVVEFRNLK